MRRDVTFESEGATMDGWFYVPDSNPPWPVVVMAHGFSATRRMVADRYAEAIVEAGPAVLLYDHRGFGESGGEPRRQINPWIQARGYRDAISFVTTLEGVDPERIALWGDSLSGGVALCVAAVDDRVAALVVQVPSIGSQPPPDDPDDTRYESLAETLRSGDVDPDADEVEGPMPVVSDDQERRPSALKPETAYRWFTGYGTRRDAGWVNEVTRARPETSVSWHPGLCARHVSCPSLFLVAPDDEMPGSAPVVARDAYDRLAGPKEWIEIPGGHFGLLYHPGETFDRVASAQTRFLVEQLSP